MKIYKITDNIYLSGSIDDYNELSKKNIDLIINARSEQHDDIYELTKQGIIYFWIPINDHLPPRLDQIGIFRNIMKKFSDRNILIHCAVGKGRSVSLIIIYMMDNGISYNNAIDIIKHKKIDVMPTSEQKRKILKLYE